MSGLMQIFTAFGYFILALALMVGAGTFGFNLFKFFFGRDEEEGFGRIRNSLIGLGIAAAGPIAFYLINRVADRFMGLAGVANN